MKRVGIFMSISVMIFVLFFCCAGYSQTVAMPDMAGWLAQHDLVYERAPDVWDEGMMLGNGDLGCVVYMEGSRLNLVLDKCDVFNNDPNKRKILPGFHWSTLVKYMEAGDRSAPIIRKSRQPIAHVPIGRIAVDFGSVIKGFKGRLRLIDAQSMGRITLESGAAEYNCFIPQERNVLVVSLVLDEGVSLPQIICQPVPYGPHSARIYAGDKKKGWYKLLPDGSEYEVRCAIEQSAKNRMTLYITVASSAEGPNLDLRVHRVLQEAQQEGVSNLKKNHTVWWQDFWSRSFLSIPDSPLESIYYLLIYQLGSAANPDKHWPMGLQAPWTPDMAPPAWQGRAHFDMNVQFQYAPVFTSNHVEILNSLTEWGWKYLPLFRRRGRVFGWDGPWLSCAVAPDGTNTIGGDSEQSEWPGTGAWMAHLYWLQYRYTMDETFLRQRAYPVMREFMKVYLGMLQKGEDGLWHIPWSCSPEFASWGPDGSADLTLIRFLCEALLESVRTLEIDDPDAPRWQDILTNLAPYPQDETGLHHYQGQPHDRQHRHLTHLLSIWPFYHINIDGPPEHQLIFERSVNNIVSFGFKPHGRRGDWYPFSFGHLAEIYAAFGNGDACLEALKSSIKLHASTNGFFHVVPYKHYKQGQKKHQTRMLLSDTFIAAPAIMDMLLQSWGGTIRLFPAVPEAWKDASFYHLRAEGAFLVSSRLKAGKVSFVSLESQAGGKCRMLNPFEGPVKCYKQGKIIGRKVSGRFIEFQTERGDTYLVLPDKVAPDSVDMAMYLPENREKRNVIR